MPWDLEFIGHQVLPDVLSLVVLLSLEQRVERVLGMLKLREGVGDSHEETERIHRNLRSAMYHVGIDQVQMVGNASVDVGFLGLTVELQEVVMLGLIQMFQEEGLQAELSRRVTGSDVGMLHAHLGRQLGSLYPIPMEARVAVKGPRFHHRQVNRHMGECLVMVRVDELLVFRNPTEQVLPHPELPGNLIDCPRVLDGHTKDVDDAALGGFAPVPQSHINRWPRIQVL